MRRFINRITVWIENFNHSFCPTCNSRNTEEIDDGIKCFDCGQTNYYGKPVIEDDSFEEDGQRW